jgi:hypothetical protein
MRTLICGACTGTGLSWFAVIPVEFSPNPTSATYSIDGGDPVTFRLNGLSPGAGTQYNQLFFSVSGLASDAHSLQVVYGGTNNATPLSLDYILLTDPSLLSSAISTTSSSSGSSTINNILSSTTLNSNPAIFPGTLTTSGPYSAASSAAGTLSSSTQPTGVHTTAVGAIAGGVVGGVVLVVLLALLVFIRRRRHKHAVRMAESISPFTSTSFAPRFTDCGADLASPTSQPSTATHLYSSIFNASYSQPVESGAGDTRKTDNSSEASGSSPAISRRIVYEDSGRSFRSTPALEEIRLCIHLTSCHSSGEKVGESRIPILGNCWANG